MDDSVLGQFPPDVLGTIVEQIGQDQHHEFLEGLVKRSHRYSVDRTNEAARDVADYFLTWVKSIVILVSPTFGEQTAEVDRRLAADDPGEPITGEKLDELLHLG